MTTGSVEIEIIDNRIVFANEDDFNALNTYLWNKITESYSLSTFENPITENDILNEWESEIGFHSYRHDYIENSTDPQFFNNHDLPLPDPVFSTIINQKKIIQVSNWIFKIDPINKQVHTLHMQNINLLPELETLDDFNDIGDILTSSFHDSVFELLAENEGEQAFWWCTNGNPYAKEDTDKDRVDYCDENDPRDYSWFVRARYDRLGLRRNLFFEFEHRDDEPWNNNGDHTAVGWQTWGNYTPRCEDPVTFDFDFINNNNCGRFDNETQLRWLLRNATVPLYSNSRALAVYELNVRAKLWSGCSGGFYGGRIHPEFGFCVQDRNIVTTRIFKIPR